MITVADLILKLSDYDPTTLVCVRDEQDLFPASDEVYPPEEIVKHGHKYMCVVLDAEHWPMS